MQLLGKVAQPRSRSVVTWSHAEFALNTVQQGEGLALESFGGTEITRTEAEPHDRMPPLPIPAVMDVQPPEQFLGSFEQFFDRVQQKAFAESPRTR